ncbi:MAG: hypothetical protein N2D54_06105 [Chloroflexota bacterium]
MIYTWRIEISNFFNKLEIGILQLTKRRWLNSTVLIGLLIAFPYLVIGKYGIFLENKFPRLWVMIVFVTMCGILLWRLWEKRSWAESLGGAVLMLAVSYFIGSFIPLINNYPFSLWWSETSHFYNAYAFVAPLFGQARLPWVYNDPLRHMLQAIPFLMGVLPIWVHRFWFQFQIIIFTFAVPIALLRHLPIQRKIFKGLFILWGVLYLAQGAIYPHLLLITALIIFGFNKDKPIRTTIFVIVLSIFGGLSRINWVPVPALIATLFYVLEMPVDDFRAKSVFNYMRMPIQWAVLGGGLGLVAMRWYQNNAEINLDIFRYPFTANLLWDRLFPNPSYTLGVLPGILLAGGPLVLLVGLYIRKKNNGFKPIRLKVIIGTLSVLFVGGLVVSTKIGAGLNLHNMDAFMVCVLITACYFYFDRVQYDLPQPAAQIGNRKLLFTIVFFPALFIFFRGGYAQSLDYNLAEESLQVLQTAVDEYGEEGEILFISQRHLLPLEMIEGVSLVPYYEKIILTEAAIANTESYIVEFRKDLRRMPYSLIVNDPRVRRTKDADKSKNEENDAYLNNIQNVLLCYYKPHSILEVGGIQLLVRKNQPCR